jgi:thiamine-monophosphate kinase
MTHPASGLGEFGRIARFFRPLAAGLPGALDLTDDAAVLDVPPGQELVVTTDAIVAGVHFLPSDRPRDIARKALRVNLSDLAAKGARPYAYTLALAVGPDVTDDWIEAFAAGLADDQRHYGIVLAGGDSVSTAGPVWVSITAFGLADAGRTVRRHGAQPGDIVLVTGTIGDAVLGLAVEQRRLGVDAADRAVLIDRYRLPQPRTRLAPAIALYAHAAIDISDGLAADFGHLCRASKVRGQVAASKVPLSPAVRRAVGADAGWMSQVFGGGDDYEVLMAVPADAVPALNAAAADAGIQLSEIGSILDSDAEGDGFFIDDSGNRLVLEKAGWTHS